MNNKIVTLLAIVLAVVFLVLNFTQHNAGTIYLALAVLSALAAVYFARKKPSA